MHCISKGKAHKRYEFGQKIAVAGTNRGSWMVGARMLPHNPYDGHILADTLTDVQAVTGLALTDAYVDKRYRGHGCIQTVTVHLPGQRAASEQFPLVVDQLWGDLRFAQALARVCDDGP